MIVEDLSAVKPEQLEIFKNRLRIVNNVEKLLQYGREYQANKRIGQMSLFQEDMSLMRPVLNDVVINSEIALAMADKEREVLGLSLTYDKYEDFFIHDKLLSNASMLDVTYNSEPDRTFNVVLEIKDILYKKSRYGNNYSIVVFEKDGLEVKAFMFGNINKKNVFRIYKKGIFIVRLYYDQETYQIHKIDPISSIDIMRYLSHIEVEIGNVNLLPDIRYHYWNFMRQKGPYLLKFKWRGEIINNFSDNVSFTKDDYIKLSSMNCNIKFIRK